MANSLNAERPLALDCLCWTSCFMLFVIIWWHFIYKNRPSQVTFPVTQKWQKLIFKIYCGRYFFYRSGAMRAISESSFLLIMSSWWIILQSTVQILHLKALSAYTSKCLRHAGWHSYLLLADVETEASGQAVPSITRWVCSRARAEMQDLGRVAAWVCCVIHGANNYLHGNSHYRPPNGPVSM